jgi:hypothetical protein
MSTRLHKIPQGGRWFVFTDDQFKAMRDAGHGEMVDALELREDGMRRNGLRYFLPHGLPRCEKERRYAGGRIIIPPSQYGPHLKNDGAAYVSDYVNDYVMLVAPRKTGKSFHAAAAIALRTVKCDKSWPIFTENGVPFREWDGPKVALISSFSWVNVAELWKVYQEILPEDELGDYARGGRRTLSFGDGRPKSLTMKKSGSEYIFLCYTQFQHVWENFKSTYLHADEQIPLEKLSAWEDGTRTMGKTQAFFSLSGFTLPDRPDTGEAGELKRGIYDGTRTRGKSVGRYHFDIPSTPDAIVSADKKRELFDMYANPKMDRTKKDERRGLAVYFPGWEPRGRMVFDADVWDRGLHVVAPWWDDGKSPLDMTKWRVVDYGSDKGINVCSWWGVAPLRVMLAGQPDVLAKVPQVLHGEVVAALYRLLYETGLEISDLVREIIRRSHNKREMIGHVSDQVTGNTYQRWKEDRCGETYWGGTILDPRSCAQSQQGQTLEEIFYRYGLQDVRPGCGQRDDIQIPRLKDWLKVDWSKPHPFRRGDGGDPMMGFPRVYFFDRRTDAGVREIEGLRMPDDGARGMINRKDPHHFVDTAKYWASDNPRYMGNAGREPVIEGAVAGGEGRTRYTGY